MAVGMKPGKVEAAWNGVLIPLRVSGTKSWVELQVSGATILKEAGCDGAISCTVYIKKLFLYLQPNAISDPIHAYICLWFDK
jgi:hypothetical protein